MGEADEKPQASPPSGAQQPAPPPQPPHPMPSRQGKPVEMDQIAKGAGANQHARRQSLPVTHDLMLDHQIPGGHPLNENKGNDLKK